MTISTKRINVDLADKRAARIPSLVTDLANTDPTVRTKARKALVALGKISVPALIRLLSHRKPHVRWEAAKALCGIAEPLAASALVNALEVMDLSNGTDRADEGTEGAGCPWKARRALTHSAPFASEAARAMGSQRGAASPIRMGSRGDREGMKRVRPYCLCPMAAYNDGVGEGAAH